MTKSLIHLVYLPLGFPLPLVPSTSCLIIFFLVNVWWFFLSACPNPFRIFWPNLSNKLFLFLNCSFMFLFLVRPMSFTPSATSTLLPLLAFITHDSGQYSLMRIQCTPTFQLCPQSTDFCFSVDNSNSSPYLLLSSTWYLPLLPDTLNSIDSSNFSSFNLNFNFFSPSEELYLTVFALLIVVSDFLFS